MLQLLDLNKILISIWELCLYIGGEKMNIVRVDAIGDNCPIPVVKAKKAIDALTESAIVW